MKLLYRVLIPISLLLGAGYGIISYDYGTPNFNQWKTIQEERINKSKKELKIDYENSVKDLFYRIDKNNDGKIDSTEFYQFYKIN